MTYEERPPMVTVTTLKNVRRVIVNFNINETEDGYEAESAGILIGHPLCMEDYGALVSSLIASRYSDSEMQAIINNNASNQGGDREYVAMQTWRNEAKIIALQALKYANDEGMLVGNFDEVENARNIMMHKVENYDISDEVNGFFIGGSLMWLNKATRVSMMSTLQIEKNAGSTETTFWWETTSYSFPVDVFEQMLAALELYAKACYGVTQQHLAQLKVMTTVEEIEAFEVTAGYPERLVFG